MNLGQLYQSLYDRLCGHHPHQYPWHFQWLAARSIRISIRKALASVSSDDRVLDVGCGSSPYRQWLPEDCSYTSMDVENGGGTPDVIISPDEPWPVKDGSYSVVLCTEVLEHVRNQDMFLTEIHRVLAPDGLLILSVPFLYNQHGSPWDYRRYSVFGLEELFSSGYELDNTQKQGSAGTVIVTLLLNWINQSLNLTKILRYIRPLLLPVWLPFCLFINIIGLCIDGLDRTGSFYQNSLILVRKT